MPEPTKMSPWRFAPLLLIALGLALAYALGVQDYLSLQYVAEQRAMLGAYVQDHLVLAALGFVAMYAVAIALVFPAPVILTIGGGLVFGWALGGSLAVLGATIGASALFLAARTAFGGFLRRRAKGVVKGFADGFENDAFLYLLVLRLTPLLPFSVLNIAPALFEIRLKTFVAATFLGIIPGAMVYAFLGSGLDGTLQAIGDTDTLSLGDLVTTEMTVALAGLFGLSLLGLALKKWALTHGGQKTRHS